MLKIFLGTNGHRRSWILWSNNPSNLKLLGLFLLSLLVLVSLGPFWGYTLVCVGFPYIVGSKYKDRKVVAAVLFGILCRISLMIILKDVFIFDDEIGYLQVKFDVLGWWKKRGILALVHHAFYYLVWALSRVSVHWDKLTLVFFNFWAGMLSSYLIYDFVVRSGEDKHRWMWIWYAFPMVLFSTFGLKEGLLGLVVVIGALGMMERNWGRVLWAGIGFLGFRVYWAVLYLVSLLTLWRRTFSILLIGLLVTLGWFLVRMEMFSKFFLIKHVSGVFLEKVSTFPLWLKVPLSFVRTLFFPSPFLPFFAEFNLDLTIRAVSMIYWYAYLPLAVAGLTVSIKRAQWQVYLFASLIIFTVGLTAFTSSPEIFRYKMPLFFLLPFLAEYFGRESVKFKLGKGLFYLTWFMIIGFNIIYLVVKV